MNNESMASFICELRKEKGLTQRQLAQQLGITDKAISKWERGAGYPDITILPKLAETLLVTTNELLNGCREEDPLPQEETIIQNAVLYADRVTKNKSKNVVKSMRWAINIVLILAILTCVICDLAITKGFTWSLYPITSIVFTWSILFPLFYFKRHRIMGSLIALSVFIIPFLFCIERISNTTWLFSFGVPIIIVAMVYLWSVFMMVTRLKNKWYAMGYSFLLAIPLTLTINIVLAKFINEAYFDVWDAMTMGFLIIMSIVMFTVGNSRKAKQEV